MLDIPELVLNSRYLADRCQLAKHFELSETNPFFTQDKGPFPQCLTSWSLLKAENKPFQKVFKCQTLTQTEKGCHFYYLTQRNLHHRYNNRINSHLEVRLVKMELTELAMEVLAIRHRSVLSKFSA